VRSRNIFFDHLLIAVRQGRQRRDAAAAGEKQICRCAAGWLYPSQRFIFGEFESLADSFDNRHIFEPQLRRLRLRHKTSAWVSYSPLGANRTII
jgi:hypothetical protein